LLFTRDVGVVVFDFDAVVGPDLLQGWLGFDDVQDGDVGTSFTEGLRKGKSETTS
jgi:hypothetical protein